MKNLEWKLELQGGGQIADTGDYDDPQYVLTNGTISLVTKDDICGEEAAKVTAALNELDAKWEDWKLSDKEFELHLQKESCVKWKQIATMLYNELREGYSLPDPLDAMIAYEEGLNNLP